MSVIFGFARWRFPTVPTKIADAGFVAGLAILFLGIFMPNYHLPPAAILLFVAGCLCFGGAAHFALKKEAAASAAGTSTPAPTNTMGRVQNNSGIVTQGQRGDNAMGPK
jgi:hypothetical protein